MAGVFGAMSEAEEKSYREYVIAQIGLALLRTRIVVNEIKAVGIALQREWINPDEAMQWMAEISALEFVQPEK